MTDQKTSPYHNRWCTYFSVQVRLEGFRLIQQSHTALPPGAQRGREQKKRDDTVKHNKSSLKVHEVTRYIRSRRRLLPWCTVRGCLGGCFDVGRMSESATQTLMLFQLEQVVTR